MATNIMQQEVGMQDKSQNSITAESNQIEFTPEQRRILGQVYQLILSWRKLRAQPVQNAEQEG